MLRVLDPNAEEDLYYIRKMHHLRYRIFIEGLNWGEGLCVDHAKEEELDEFDHKDARYIIYLDKHDEVVACTRIISMLYPCAIKTTFSSYIKREIPPVSQVCEISKFCADKQSTPQTIMAILIAAILKYCLGKFSYSISISNPRIIQRTNDIGWEHEILGEFVNEFAAVGRDIDEKSYFLVLNGLNTCDRGLMNNWKP